MAESVDISVVVWSCYITLKLFSRTLENDVIKASLFHIFCEIFFKSFVILVFRNTHSPYIPILIMID